VNVYSFRGERAATARHALKSVADAGNCAPVSTRRLMSAFEGEAEMFCSIRALPILTQLGHSRKNVTGDSILD
jgi:hypothetical protein